MSDKTDLAKQVGDQCLAVAHMASVIADVYRDYYPLLRSIEAGGKIPLPLEQVGRRTAALMETLGNVLNGMDAVTDEDAWLDPIFERAQQRWPSEDLAED